MFYHALVIGGYHIQGAFEIALNTVNASSDSSLQGDNFLLLPIGEEDGAVLRRAAGDT